MVSKCKALVFILFCLSLSTLPAIAETKACLYRQPMLALADALLRELDAPDSQVAKTYARDAAYLKLHYGTMTPAEIEGMLDRMMRTGTRGAVPFSYSYYLSKIGFKAANDRMGGRLIDGGDGRYDPTLARALAMAGHEDLAITMARQYGAWPDEHYLFPAALPYMDRPPEQRQRLADLAEREGAAVLAGQLYASLPDYTAWKAYLKRNFTGIGYVNLKPSFAAYSAFNFDSLPLPDPKNGVNGLLFRQFVQKIAAMSWLLPESALLYEFSAEYKFEPIYGARAARTLKKALDLGEIKPDGPIEKSWLLTYRALAGSVDDPNIVVDKMQQVTITSRHYLRGTAGDILDTMLTAEAIGPWLRGETATFPPVPRLASARLMAAWPKRRVLAEAIKAGRDPGDIGRNSLLRGVAADLSYAKGDAAELLALIAAEKNDDFRQRMTADFMTRYDRLCDSSLYFPGDGLFLRDSTVYRFDALPK